MQVPDEWDAAVLVEAGASLRIMRIRRPELRSGQVLVRVDAAGVCRSQLMEARGLRGPDRWLPHLLGHEGVGAVVEVGDGVTKVAPGQAVVLSWIAGRGRAAGGTTLRTSDGMIVNAGPVTTFGEFAVVSEDRVFSRPPGIAQDVAAVLGCAVLTGAGMVINDARVESGTSVLIAGIGGVGLSALLAARARGAEMVAIDPNPERRRLAVEMGARLAVDPTRSDWQDELRGMFPGGADVAIDASGTTAAVESLLPLVGAHGCVVFASHPASGERLSIDPHLLIQGRRLLGSWGGGSRPDDDLLEVSRLIGTSAEAAAFGGSGYTLDRIDEALSDLEAGRTVRPVIILSDAGRGAAST